MLLDWSNPPELDAPRRRWTRQLNADRIKLVRLKQSRAKGPKNHSTNKERSHIERTKAATVAKHAAEHRAARLAYNAKVRAYWAGETDCHPLLSPSGV